VFGAAADIYRRTRKPNDIFWNRFVARPLAALVVVPLARTGITPNQVTFATLPVFLAGAALLALWPSWGAFVAGAGIIELSYVLDCADGQLARLKGTSSPVGAHLDFLMDELKAFTLVAAIAIRLWMPDRDPRWLLEGVACLAVVAAAISLTTFTRRPEYAASPLALVEALGRFVVHYPSHIWLVALVNRVDIFLHAYLIMNAAYAARAFLGITRALGRKR
jgi:hypothetical protein